MAGAAVGSDGGEGPEQLPPAPAHGVGCLACSVCPFHRGEDYRVKFLVPMRAVSMAVSMSAVAGSRLRVRELCNLR